MGNDHDAPRSVERGASGAKFGKQPGVPYKKADSRFYRTHLRRTAEAGNAYGGGDSGTIVGA